MTTPVTVFTLALTTVTAPGGPFGFGLGFGAVASGAAAASAGADPDKAGEGPPSILGEELPIILCALTAVTSARRTAQENPMIREQRIM